MNTIKLEELPEKVQDFLWENCSAERFVWCPDENCHMPEEYIPDMYLSPLYLNKVYGEVYDIVSKDEYEMMFICRIKNDPFYDWVIDVLPF